MKKALVLAVLCGIGVSLAAQSDDKPVSSQPLSPGLSAIQTANNLANYGYSNYSASALIGAAEIFVSTQTQDLGVSPTTEGPQAAEGTKTARPEFTPARLIADARSYAAGDAAMLAWAARVEGSINTTRGAVGGAKQGNFAVNARSTDQFTISFTAGRLAEIAISGDGDTDLDLYVYDSGNNLIAYNEDYSDRCYVSWVPRWTGSYTVKVVNRGSVYNRYVIATN
jgi:hypothetical protein